MQLQTNSEDSTLLRTIAHRSNNQSIDNKIIIFLFFFDPPLNFSSTCLNKVRSFKMATVYGGVCELLFCRNV